MKITIETITIEGNKRTKTTENVQKDDLRIEILSSFRSLDATYNLLDCVFDYECSQTKYGYKITKTIVQHKETKNTTIQKISYN